MKPKRMHFDIETRSRKALSGASSGGVLTYADDESTEILCISFTTDLWDKAYDVTPRGTNSTLDELDFEDGNGKIFKDLFETPDIELHAWNESFERIVMQVCGSISLGLKVPSYTRFHCTMLQAMYYNLPASLGNAGEFLQKAGVTTIEIKSQEGKNTMLQLCKPRKPSKDDSNEWYERTIYPEKYDTLYKYCNQDVMCEKSISDFLAPLPAQQTLEKRLTTRMNAKGVRMDLESVELALKVATEFKVNINDTFRNVVSETFGDHTLDTPEEIQREDYYKEVTKQNEKYEKSLLVYEKAVEAMRLKGKVSRRKKPVEPTFEPFRVHSPKWTESYPEGFKATQGAVFLNYLRDIWGYTLKGFDETSRDEFLRRKDIPEKLRGIIDLYIQANNSFVIGKLKKFKACTARDMRVHDSLKFYGATMTGRWAGAGIQGQNLPSRGLYGDVEGAFENLHKMTPKEFLENYEEEGVLHVLKSMLRGFLVSSKGTKFAQYDYSSIESRVVIWLANDKEMLDVVENGLCLYREACKNIFGYSHEKAHSLASGSWERKVAKEYVLSLCYGTGHGSLGKKIFENTNGDVDFRCNCPTIDGKVKHSCEAKRLVNLYRSTNSGVVELWNDMGNAAIKAVQNPGKVYKAGIFKFIKKSIFLYMRLPNGRTLKYPAAEVEEVDTWGNGNLEPSLFFRGEDNMIKKTKEELRQGRNYKSFWRKKRMWGSKFFQNGCQAIARDLIQEAMIRLERVPNSNYATEVNPRDSKYTLVLSIHDEVLLEADEDVPDSEIDEEVCRIMCEPVEWAEGIPLKVEGTCRYRFGK